MHWHDLGEIVAIIATIGGIGTGIGRFVIDQRTLKDEAEHRRHNRAVLDAQKRQTQWILFVLSGIALISAAGLIESSRRGTRQNGLPTDVGEVGPQGGQPTAASQGATSKHSRTVLDLAARAVNMARAVPGRARWRRGPARGPQGRHA